MEKSVDVKVRTWVNHAAKIEGMIHSDEIRIAHILVTSLHFTHMDGNE